MLERGKFLLTGKENSVQASNDGSMELVMILDSRSYEDEEVNSGRNLLLHGN